MAGKKKKTAPTKKTTGRPAAGKKTAAAKKPANGPLALSLQTAGKRGELPRQAVKAPGLPAGKKFPIVGIGASAGGLEAFQGFFQAMPPDRGLAFILVAHLAPNHVSILPELIQKQTTMPVFLIADGMQVKPNTVYVIPPGKELAILNGVLQLMDQTEQPRLHLPIDTFFRSLARDQGENAICIILSGTGSDGTSGLRAIKGEGGMAMVQDEMSAMHAGMPQSAMHTGLADYVLPPADMPEQLLKYIRHAARGAGLKIPLTEKKLPDGLQKIFLLLRTHSGHDFSLYKSNTIVRRIERRMHVQQIDSMQKYVRFLQGNEHEVGTLFKELLIGVTNFFRDPEAFQALEDKFLPELLRQRPEGSILRGWVPGCSTGEEAYSIAILLQETMERLNRRFVVQIFGTDIDEDAIDHARAGRYPASISADVSPLRLKQYFTKEGDRYRIRKLIREMMVFAPQNLIKDPPFTKLDLLCCRNLLIYFGQELQRKILPLFHYSLKPHGILFLGSSETIGPATDLFKPLDRKWKIFQRQPTASAASPLPEFPVAPPFYEERKTELLSPLKRGGEIRATRLLEAILRQSDSPPCAIIDNTGNIVYIYGRIGTFLEPAAGTVSNSIIDMARPGLKRELAAAVREVGAQMQQVVSKGLHVQQNGGSVSVELTVKPIFEPGELRGMMMVIFKETALPLKETADKKGPAVGKEKGKDIKLLEEELVYTRENLQTTIEELEASNEELKSTNEELQSSNEELQSTNEELETSREELQSLNEETTTVNIELQNRIDELASANDDLKNLFDSSLGATIFLDNVHRVKRFTKKATEIVSLMPSDIGRPIQHFALNLQDVNLATLAAEVLDTLEKKETEVASGDGRFYVMRISPYRTVNNVIDGVVITFEDVTRYRKLELELELRNTRTFAESIVETVREPLLVLDEFLNVVSANRSFYRTFNIPEEETMGKKLYALGNGQWNIPRLQSLLEEILPEDKTVESFEMEHDFPQRGYRKMLLNARRLRMEGKDRALILLAIEDVTDRPEQ